MAAECVAFLVNPNHQGAFNVNEEVLEASVLICTQSSPSAVLMGMQKCGLQYHAAFRLELSHKYTMFLESRCCGGDSLSSNSL